MSELISCTTCAAVYFAPSAVNHADWHNRHEARWGAVADEFESLRARIDELESRTGID
jgi:hypothetical protein